MTTSGKVGGRVVGGVEKAYIPLAEMVIGPGLIPTSCAMKFDSQMKIDDKPDNVNHPAHYKLFPNQEAIDIIRATLTEDEYIGYCKGNALKYRLRAGLKGDNAIEDLAKANWYRDQLF